MLRIGLWGPLYYVYKKGPQNLRGPQGLREQRPLGSVLARHGTGKAGWPTTASLLHGWNRKLGRQPSKGLLI